MNTTLTPDILSVFLGGLISLVLNRFPKINTWFSGLDPDNKSFTKQLVVLLACLGGLAVIFALRCAGGGIADMLNVPQVTCDRVGVSDLLWNFVLLVVGTQTAYPLLKDKSIVSRDYFEKVVGDILTTPGLVQNTSQEAFQPSLDAVAMREYNKALEWAAEWITGPQMDGNDESVVKFAKNMAMSIRAAKKK